MGAASNSTTEEEGKKDHGTSTASTTTSTNNTTAASASASVIKMDIDQDSSSSATQQHHDDNKVDAGGDGGGGGGGEDNNGEGILLDDEMLDEYKEWLTDLGFFPDKVSINSLTMVAEDYSSNPNEASRIYNTIRTMLIDTENNINAGRKLPLLYVVDSILKNARGRYVKLIEDDAKEWIPMVYRALENRGGPSVTAPADGGGGGGGGDDGSGSNIIISVEQNKMKKVLTTWKDFGLFRKDVMDDMMRSFDEASAEQQCSAQSKKKMLDDGVGGGGEQGTDGLRNVSSQVRKQMQMILDDMHTDVDELDRVSLERLATINPELLNQIKSAATESLAASSGGVSGTGDSGSGREGGGGKGNTSPTGASASSSAGVGGGGGGTPTATSVIPETRPHHDIELSNEWASITSFTDDGERQLVGSLQQFVRKSTTTIGLHSPSMGLVVAASATATHLTHLVQRWKELEDEAKGGKKRKKTSRPPWRRSVSVGTTSSHVRKDQFTTDGILGDKDDWVVGQLYERGLPFVSSADGRRFATQIELSRHLDELFRKRQVEVTMERTEERGWYVSSKVWMGQTAAGGSGTDGGAGATGDGAGGGTGEGGADGSGDDDVDPSQCRVLADEARSRCAICGLSFNMVFDQDEGEWMYDNCREVEVMNDDAAEVESESMLTHVTCLRTLGSPGRLARDQVLQS